MTSILIFCSGLALGRTLGVCSWPRHTKKHTQMQVPEYSGAHRHTTNKTFLSSQCSYILAPFLLSFFDPSNSLPTLWCTTLPTSWKRPRRVPCFDLVCWFRIVTSYLPSSTPCVCWTYLNVGRSPYFSWSCSVGSKFVIHFLIWHEKRATMQ